MTHGTVAESIRQVAATRGTVPEGLPLAGQRPSFDRPLDRKTEATDVLELRLR